MEYPPHELIGITLDNFNNIALQAAAPILAADSNLSNITMEDLVHLPLGEKHVLFALRRDKKAIAIRMSGDFTGNQLHLTGDGEDIAPVNHQLTISDHGPKPILQGVPLAFSL